MSALRRHATTIVLCVTAVAALIAVFVWDRGSVSTSESLARKKDLFDAWRLDDVTEVTVTNKGRTAKLVRQKTNDAGNRPWDVEIDRDLHPAEEQIVDQFLGTLEFATAERRVSAEGIDRKEMGLGAPRETIVVAMGVQRFELLVGGPAPSPEGAAYVEVKGHGVSVITEQLLAALDVGPDQFRSRAFVPYVSTDLASITLDGAGGHRKFARADWAGSRTPAFSFEDGDHKGVRVAAPPLDRLLVAFADLQAETFLSDDEAKSASKPEVTVTLAPTDAAKKTVKIEVGGACPSKPESVVAVRDQPTKVAVCVPKAPLEAMSLAADDFIDRRLIGAPPDEITEVKIESDGKVLEVARSGAEWHVRRPDDRRADAEVGKIFLGSLLLVEGDEVTHGDVTAKATARIVSLRSGDDRDAGPTERIEELSWGEPVNGRVLVKRAEDGAVISVAADRMAAFRPSDLALRSRKVVDESLTELRAIRVEGGGRVQKIDRNDDGTFTLVEPKGQGLAPDAGLVSDLAQALLSLTADQWIADQDDGTHGLATPRFTIEAVLGEATDSGEQRKVKVMIGASASAGSFAQKDGDPAVFVAPRALEVAANRWLLDRGALAIDGPQIGAATLRANGKKVELQRRGSAWELHGAASAADAEAVFAALADLVADGAVSVGAKMKAGEGFEHPSLEIEVGRTAGVPVKLTFGASDTFEGASVVYARRAGIDATYVVSKSKLRSIFDALGVP